MDMTGKTPAEIQQYIYSEIAAGTHVEKLKTDLRSKGIPIEAYYFTSQEEQHRIISEPPAAASNVSTGTIIWTVIAVIIMIIRIARCSSSM